MAECSIFVDESGGQNGTSKYYAVTLVVHEQYNDVYAHFTRYAALLRDRGFDDIPLHASPLLNAHGDWEFPALEDRKCMLSLFFTLFIRLPIRYRTFLYRRSEVGDADAFEARIRRDIVAFLFDEFYYF